MFTIEDVKNRLINNSVALRHTFNKDGNSRDGILKAERGTVYFIPTTPDIGERPKWVITTVSAIDDKNLTKIECNRIAKEFVKNYPLKELQKEFLEVYLTRR